MSRNFYFLFLAIFEIWLLGASAFAQTWNGSASNTWSNPANWTGGLPANNGTANVIFPTSSSQAYILDANWNVNTLTFSGNCLWDVHLSSNSAPATVLTLQNGITNTIVSSLDPDQPVVISNLTIQLAQPQTWNIQTNASIATLITGSGGFTKIGAGTLVLASGNTYSGGTSINAGIISATGDSSFGNASGSLQLNGGTLNLDQGPTMFSRSISVGSSGGTISAVRDLNLSSFISGAGALVISTGTSTGYLLSNVNLSGSNTFTGGLTLSNSLYSATTPAYSNWTVQVTGTNTSLGSGPVALTAGTTLSINALSNLGTGKKITLPATTTLIVTSDAFDPAQIIDPASTQSSLQLAASIYTRALNMAQIGDGSLTLGASTGTVAYTAASLQPGAGNVYRLGGGVGTLGIGGNNNNVLTGNASLVMTGSLNLLNSNNFTGGTTINGGTLGLGTSGALGSGLVTLAGGNITSINGAALPNPVAIQGQSRLTGPLTLSGTVNLQGGVPVLFLSGTVNFENVIGNGTFNVNSGIAVLQAKNTFSQLDLWEGAASISSVNNLGGPTTPISFDGIYSSGTTPTGSGTLETTTSMMLTNPISFHRSSNANAILQVDPGTTLTLTETISNGQINKTGAGNLVFASGSSLSGTLSVYSGNTTSAGNTLTNANVQTNAGGSFTGSGNVKWLTVEGGQVAPGGGTGGIVAPIFDLTSFYGPSNFQFQFNQTGSPNYSNLANSGNGFLSVGVIGSGASFNGNIISIFLATPTIQLGSTYKGAIFIQSTSPISSTLFNGTTFAFYVPSSGGATSFNGQNFSPLNSAQYAVQQTWVAENGGQVTQFKIVPSLGSPPAIAALGALYSFTFPNSGSPTYAVTAGSLPPGITLSASGVLSGTPTSTGSYTFAITSTDSTGANTIESFSLTVPSVATDTPTLPPWALALLAVLLSCCAQRFLPRKPGHA